jgi:hypothetical protein
MHERHYSRSRESESVARRIEEARRRRQLGRRRGAPGRDRLRPRLLRRAWWRLLARLALGRAQCRDRLMGAHFATQLTPGGYLAGEVSSALQKSIRLEREALCWATELDLAGFGNYVFKLADHCQRGRGAGGLRWWPSRSAASMRTGSRRGRGSRRISSSRSASGCSCSTL